MRRFDPGTALSFKAGWGAAIALALGACARTIDPSAAISLGKAAALVDEQSAATFTEGNRLVRRVSVDRFVRSGDIALSEDKFAVVVTPESAAAWSQVLATIQRYAALLASLTDTSRGPATVSAIDELTTELNRGAVKASISPGVGAAVASFAGALVEARAQADARRIAATVDPAFQATVRAMAEAVGADDRAGLRGTVRAAWTAALDGSRRPYIDAAGSRDQAQQRALVAAFLASVDARDAQLRTLADLRASLLALGTAHAALAGGQPRALGPLLDTIAARATATKALYARLQPASM